MHSGGTWRLGHRPGLDGLRGVAILLVLASHGGVPYVALAGSAGVGLFFVLSGFLIATLLLEEADRSGRVEVVAFYRRRALRLLPALFAMVAVVVLIGFVVDGFTSRRMVLGTLFYGSNWVKVGGLEHPDALAHTWSLSIEEQFYLVAPFVVFALRRHARALLALAVSGAAGDMLVRTWMATDSGFSGDQLHYATYLRLDGFLVGIALAVALRLGSERHPSWSLVLGVVTLLVVCVVPLNVRVFYGAVPFAVSLAAVPLIRHALADGLSWRWLVWVGRRSYGIYLWHYPMAVLATRAEFPWQLTAAVVVVGGVGLAAASYRWIEQPFLRIKDRQRQASGMMVPVASSQSPEAPQSMGRIVSVAASQSPDAAVSIARSVSVARSHR